MSARVYSPGVATGLRLIFLCLNVGHELQGTTHRAVVSVSWPVRRPVQCRCAISIPGVSAGENNSDNISSSGCAGSSVGAISVR